jgi:hypothetical protein
MFSDKFINLCDVITMLYDLRHVTRPGNEQFKKYFAYDLQISEESRDIDWN